MGPSRLTGSECLRVLCHGKMEASCDLIVEQLTLTYSAEYVELQPSATAIATYTSASVNANIRRSVMDLVWIRVPRSMRMIDWHPRGASIVSSKTATCGRHRAQSSTIMFCLIQAPKKPCRATARMGSSLLIVLRPETPATADAPASDLWRRCCSGHLVRCPNIRRAEAC